MRDKDANLANSAALASKKQLNISRICLLKPVYIFKARQSSVDAPQGCKLALGQEARHWLPKSNQPDVIIYLYFLTERNIDMLKARQGLAGAPRMQACT